LRVGIFGGSFDPPHCGHLILAADARIKLELDVVLFIPSAVQPHKQGLKGQAAPEQRLAMVRAAVGSESGFLAEPMELERGGLSYTVDTLEELAPKYPGAELFLIIGEDSARALDTWHKPERIKKMVTLGVLRRHNPADLPLSLPKGAVEASSRLVDVSSSEIRERVKTGKSIHGFVPEVVEHYIRSNGLYR
jgi:nicotinate-nucleotide adenylyltransferase